MLDPKDARALENIIMLGAFQLALFCSKAQIKEEKKQTVKN